LHRRAFKKSYQINPTVPLKIPTFHAKSPIYGQDELEAKVFLACDAGQYASCKGIKGEQRFTNKKNSCVRKFGPAGT